MLLGLDLGTLSLKALLLDMEGRVVAEASRGYRVQAPYPGWAESDPGDWWKAAGEATREVTQRYPQVQAIGLSGQMHGVVPCKADGTPLCRAILWADTRSGDELEPYRELSAPFRRKLANPIVTGMAGPSLLWLKRHQPQLYQQADVALQPKDWLRLRLTGAVAAEPSDASATLLYDLEADAWFVELIEALGLRQELLAPLVPSTAVAGTLTPEAAEHLGLPAGIPVAAGAADTAAAMLGSGLVSPGVVQLTIGSGAQMVAPLERPTGNPEQGVHLYRAALPDCWYAMAAMQNAGLALEWVRGILGLSWEQAYAEAFSVPAGCEGLSFLPYLTGERTPHLDPSARGHWAGLGLSHSRGHLMRSALEGLAFSIREGMEALESAGVAIPELRLAGGGSTDPRWRQLLADVLQKPLLASPTASASGRGAALLGGLAIGVEVPPVPAPLPVAQPQAQDALAVAYQRFKKLYAALRGATP